MEFSFEKLENRVFTANTLLCVGLDPHKGQLERPELECALQFCINIIEKTHKYAAAFKPNSAFFEAFGEAGFAALKKVIARIPSDIPIILDCKRGDIDTTAMAYADASFNYFNADCVTLSPYMGWDSISPFVTGKFSNKSVFVLCKTSNKSSTEIQDLTLCNGHKVYEKVVELCHEWNNQCLEIAQHSSVGLVVGATDAAAMEKIRQLAPEAWILCPGVGSQGGDLQNACLNGLRSDGSGMLISVSRGISGATDIEAMAMKYRDDINAARQLLLTNNSVMSTVTEESLEEFQKDFIRLALDANVLQFGQFTLKSGRSSPYFFNAGNFCNGLHIRNLGRSYAEAIHRSNIQFEVLFGPAYKGIPIAAAIAVAYYELYGISLDVSYNRKEAKDHGEGGTLVGCKVTGRRVLVVDDVITAGTAIKESMSILSTANAVVVGVTVCLDRQERGSNLDKPSQTAIQQVEEEYSIPVVSIIKLQHLVNYVQTDCKDQSIVEAMKNVATTLGLMKC